jgi:hypothetical protein
MNEEQFKTTISSLVSFVERVSKENKDPAELSALPGVAELLLRHVGAVPNGYWLKNFGWGVD